MSPFSPVPPPEPSTAPTRGRRGLLLRVLRRRPAAARPHLASHRHRERALSVG